MPRQMVVGPNLADVRALADELHARGEAWPDAASGEQGEAFDWPAEYNPEQL